MIVKDKKLQIYYSTHLNDSQYFSGFSTKAIGDGTKTTDIFRFLDNNKIPYKKVIVLNQIHSANVVYYSGVETQGSFEKIEDCDGVVTGAVNTTLVVRTADCVPILFADKTAGLIGASHQGWRGSLKKLPVRMVDEMVNKGSQIGKILVSIGPSIGACCYDVDEERYYSFLEQFNGITDKIFTVVHGKRYLNLPFLNYLLLINRGIRKENIDFFPFCTKCNRKEFFSYRREGKKLEGEMFSYIMRRAAGPASRQPQN